LQAPEEAAAYLDAALEEGDREVFLLALRDVAEARLGGMGELAQQSGLNREALYRTLSAKGNPELSSFSSSRFGYKCLKQWNKALLFLSFPI
jgi:probable addiction module antidote protein